MKIEVIQLNNIHLGEVAPMARYIDTKTRSKVIWYYFYKTLKKQNYLENAKRKIISKLIMLFI